MSETIPLLIPIEELCLKSWTMDVLLVSVLGPFYSTRVLGGTLAQETLV